MEPGASARCAGMRDLIRGKDAGIATDVIFDIRLEELEHDPYPTYVWMRRHRSRSCPTPAGSS
jgi:hypothetical protein